MSLLPGDKIAVPAQWGITHVGIYAGNGLVVHNSKAHGRVVEEPLAAFSEGVDVQILARARPGTGEEVVARARALLGTGYALLRFNCEHLTSLVLTGDAQSPQLQRGLFATFVALLFAAVAWDQRGWDPTVGRHRDGRGRFRSTWL